MQTTLTKESVARELADRAVNGDLLSYQVLGYLLKSKTINDGCWVLEANLNHAGYTTMSFNNKRYFAHRLLFELMIGSIDEDMVVDHMCHNEAASRFECKGGMSCPHRACFNPYHMKLSTQQENTANGSRGFYNRRTCPSGHTRDSNNVRLDNLNRPFCWECRKESTKIYKRKMRKRKKVD